MDPQALSALIAASKRTCPRGLFAHRLVCKDGFSVSVQASCFHYSTPRLDHPAEGWVEYELGFPSNNDPIIAKYEEQYEGAGSGVYPYAPAQVVIDLIAAHGGLKENP